MFQPRTFVRLFQPRFAPLITRGEKRQTVRKHPKRMPRSGDFLDARQWAGRPYRSKQIYLGIFPIRHVSEILLTALEPIVISGDLKLHIFPEIFAKKDGFKTYLDLWQWFEENHQVKSEFRGIVIFWANLNLPFKSPDG